MSQFKGWAAFSVYGVEGEDGAIYLSANGVKAKCSFATPMGRALSQLAVIQAEAASPLGGATGSLTTQDSPTPTPGER